MALVFVCCNPSCGNRGWDQDSSYLGQAEGSTWGIQHNSSLRYFFSLVIKKNKYLRPLFKLQSIVVDIINYLIL